MIFEVRKSPNLIPQVLWKHFRSPSILKLLSQPSCVMIPAWFHSFWSVWCFSYTKACFPLKNQAKTYLYAWWALCLQNKAEGSIQTRSEAPVKLNSIRLAWKPLPILWFSIPILSFSIPILPFSIPILSFSIPILPVLIPIRVIVRPGLSSRGA